MLTAERLRQLLSYDPATGVFINRVNRGTTARAGEVAGGLDGEGYILIRIENSKFGAHRLAWLYMTGEWPKGKIDHKDTIKSHNQWDNLRPASHSQNCANQHVRRTNKLGVKGVYWKADRNGYIASLRVREKRYYFGPFDTVAEAAAAYAAAAKIHFGEFARS